jgi:ABC-type microcin C transport system permease subunit YejB
MRISIRYLVTSLLTIIPTLFDIMLITFILIQFAPGEPIEQTLARINARSPVSGDTGLQRSDDPDSRLGEMATA